MSTTPNNTETNLPVGIDEILDASPINKEVPEDIWKTIYATWTGLWTDGYGEWDEKQASDLFPISDLLSSERLEWLKQAIALELNKARLSVVDDLIIASGGYGPDRSYSRDSKGFYVVDKKDVDDYLANLQEGNTND